MSPIAKRGPPDSVEALERTSSSPDPNRGDKRLRLSTVPPDSDVEVQHDHVDNHNSHSFLVGTQAEFEALRDEASEEEPELDERKKLDKMKREMERRMDNNARENGIIEKVTCINFMCHKHLTIELGPLINFIIGHNGSGKSAVLTAIQLCLGGKATSTNRGQNLKAFVKQGEDNAVLIVKIKNGGDSGYRPEIYGNSITVERHFSKNGPSSFKIKSAAGKIISTKRSELDDITDFYAFQLDNPVNVLTQDMARQFLNNSSEVEKYKFFIRGVQLEQLDNDYALVWESLGNTEAQLENVSDNAKALRQTAKDAKRKFDDLNKQNDLRSRLENCKRQIAWVQVEQEEHELEKCEQSIRDADAKIEQSKSSAERQEAAFSEADQAQQDAFTAHAELESSLAPLDEKHKDAKEEFDKHKGELLTHQSEQRQLHQMLQASGNTISKLQSDIQEERRRLEDVDGGANATRLSDIEQAERNLADAKTENDDHPLHRPSLEKDVRNAETKLTAAKEAQSRKTEEVKSAETSLKNLKSDRGDRKKAYHFSLADFELAIQREKRWHEKPMGPIGDYVQLLKPEWSSVLERYFGNTLNGFIVTNKHDENLLSAIARRTRYFSPTYLTRAAPISTSAHEPDQKFDTIMRVLKFDNDVVRNQLIIQQSVDQTLLIRNREAGQATMFAAGGPPKNSKSALVMHDHNRGYGFRLATNNAGEKIDPIIAWTGPARLKTDIGAQIQMQEERVSGLKDELHLAERQVTECETQKRKCKQAMEAHDRKAKVLLKDFQRAEDRVAALKAELEAATPQDGKLDGLKDSLREAEEERDFYQSQYDGSKTTKTSLDARGAELKRTVDDLSKELETLRSQVSKAKTKADKRAEKRTAKLREKNEAIEAIKDAEKEKESREERKAAQITQLESFNQLASEISMRVPVERGQTYATLTKRYENMQEQLSRAERELGGTREHITAEAMRTKDDFQRVERSRHNLIALQETLQQSIRDRSYRWLQFRKNISSRARIQFMYLMSERGFHGRMSLKHEEKKLQLHVQPDKVRNAGRGNATTSQGQTKTLSGGEKSYSTICLLLALWDAMGSPVRCLDEFDVFMDSVNRDHSLKLMITAARRSVGRQFILITPQAMSKIDAGPDVKIIRLSDPERGQTTLNVEQ